MKLRSPFSLLLCSLLLMTAAPAAVIIYKTAAGTSGNLVETVKADATRTIDFANTALRLRDTNASHQLIIAPGSDLSANRTLTITTGDASRTLTLTGNPTLGTNDLSPTGSPTFAGLSTGSGAISGGAINGTTGVFDAAGSASPGILTGAGGTGTNVGTINVRGGSGAGGGAFIRFLRNATVSGYVGSKVAIIGSGTSDDFALYSDADVTIYGGSALSATFTSTGLALPGTLGATGVYSTTTASAANVFVDSNGLLQRSTSSMRYKANVRDYTRGLGDVMRLRPIWFDDKRTGSTHAGLAAEDVDAAGLKEFVEYDNQRRPDAVAYGHMVSLAFKAIQDLKADNDSLRARVAAVEPGHTFRVHLAWCALAAALGALGGAGLVQLSRR